MVGCVKREHHVILHKSDRFSHKRINFSGRFNQKISIKNTCCNKRKRARYTCCTRMAYAIGLHTAMINRSVYIKLCITTKFQRDFYPIKFNNKIEIGKINGNVFSIVTFCVSMLLVVVWRIIAHLCCQHTERPAEIIHADAEYNGGFKTGSGPLSKGEMKKEEQVQIGWMTEAKDWAGELISGNKKKRFIVYI